MRREVDVVRHRVVNWLITPLFLVLFVALLLVFHLFQLAALCISRRRQKEVLDLMNLGIILLIRGVAGASWSVRGAPHLPPGRPVILVSNHQSMYDIPMIMWICRAREVGFIAKRELGRWIPSISIALRRLGSVLIDRGDVRQAVRAIGEFGARKEREREVACIFPEGTRARDGVLKRFKSTGLQALVQAMPTALIQPVAIRGNWELLQYGFLPIPYGTQIEVIFLEPLESTQYTSAALVEELERRIRQELSAGGEVAQPLELNSVSG